MNDIASNDNEEQQKQHDNSATIPRSNISSPQHTKQQQQPALLQSNSTNNNTSSKIVEGKASPAVVELSSLFQTESTLFRDESQHSSGKICVRYGNYIIAVFCVIVFDNCNF